jgi:amino acid permease
MQVANLVTAAVGAGMLALPCAVSRVGILLGGTLFFAVAALTFVSCTIIVR